MRLFKFHANVIRGGEGRARRAAIKVECDPWASFGALKTLNKLKEKFVK